MAKERQSIKLSPSGLGSFYSGKLNISLENILWNLHRNAIYDLTTMI
jgi:hypothetical protein